LQEKLFSSAFSSLLNLSKNNTQNNNGFGRIKFYGSFDKKLKMNLPQVNNNNVSQFLNQAEIVQETAEQIMKDFGMFGVEITFSGNTNKAYDELHRQLIDQIGTLLERNYDLLLSVLYQVDITDREIAKTERELPEYSHIEIVAHTVIVRDLKKVLLRRYFKSQNG